MTRTHAVVFLFDVDNTLLDNDSVQAHLDEHLEQAYGVEARDSTGRSLEDCGELGHVDYPGALKRFRVEPMHRPDVLRMSSWLVDYPFADRLYSGALDALKHVSTGSPRPSFPTVDAAFQPRKVERSGLFRVIDDRVVIYIDKECELEHITQPYPADHTCSSMCASCSEEKSEGGNRSLKKH